MAVTMAKISGHMFQGTSSDTKPTPQSINAIFYETDTGKFYIFNGASWSLSSAQPPMRFW